jgi:guanine nucleotide-binding protein G(i) subunit alpha
VAKPGMMRSRTSSSATSSCSAMKSKCFFWVRSSVSTQREYRADQKPGAGESGKSTILKQMKLIHEGGYSRDERESFKEIIYSNTVQSMRVILEAMESLELPLDDQRAEYHVQTIFMQPPQIEGDSLPPEVGSAIAALWKDAGVQECFKRSREYQLNDSAR